MEPRILVIGKNGQVAQALIERAGIRGLPLLGLGRDVCDLKSITDLPPQADAFQPDVMINAAAYTSVDKAESDAEAAHAINTLGAGRLAEAASKRGIPLMHISTDYVYDGTKPSPYIESDPVAPLGVYGASKLAGELAVRAAHSQALIFRTAWVYSPFGGNFVKTMLRLAGERDQIGVVDDQIGNPTSALDIAEALLDIAMTMTHDDQRSRAGIWHLTCSGEASWYDFARAIFEVSARLGGPSIPVTAIPTSAYPTPTARPANSRLDCGKLAADFGLRLPHWRDSLVTVVERLVRNV